MSAIAEAIGFDREAAELRKRLREDDTLTPEQRATLERRADHLEQEARWSWSDARHEAMADAADDDRRLR